MKRRGTDFPSTLILHLLRFENRKISEICKEHMQENFRKIIILCMCQSKEFSGQNYSYVVS